MIELWRSLAATSAGLTVVLFLLIVRGHSGRIWPERRDALGDRFGASAWASHLGKLLLRPFKSSQQIKLERSGEGLELALLALSAELETGTALSGALVKMVNDLPEPAAGELRQALAHAPIGDGVAIVRQWAQLRSDPALNDLAATLALQQGTGGSLAPLFHRLAAATRQRRLLHARAHARSAEARLSAIILAAAPGAIALFIGISQPELLAPLWYERIGRVALVYAFISWAVGILWIRHMLQSVSRLGLDR